jgi:hypothetical protein
LGSGYTFHNLGAFFNPKPATIQASIQFNEWIKDTMLQHNRDQLLNRLKDWKSAPCVLICHPREEHLLPLFMVAAAGTANNCLANLIYDTTPAEQPWRIMLLLDLSLLSSQKSEVKMRKSTLFSSTRDTTSLATGCMPMG